MAAVTKETLKKHHFWILVGLTPLLVVIAAVMIDSSAGAEIEKRNKEVTSARDSFKGKESPKSEKLIAGFNSQLTDLGTKRTDLWKENWDRQIGLVAKKANGKDTTVQDPSKNLLRWPKSSKFDTFNYSADYSTKKGQLKFGDPIPEDDGQWKEFTKREIYLAEYTNPTITDIARDVEKRTGMADRVYPTTFAGGWQSVLRHVQTPEGWGQQVPKPEQLWLVLEDIWVQRALLGAISSVNDSVARFRRVNTDEKGVAVEEASKLERSFVSRIWRVNLKVAQRPGDGRYVISGSIKNITDRLQLTGSSNTLVLNVWLSNAPGTQPIPFKIGGEFIAGGAKMEISPSEDHVLPAGTTVEEIARVEQVFDSKTVPIRRIDHVALGKRDSRYAAFPLEMPQFESFKKEAEAEAAKAASGSSGGPMGGVGGPPPGVGSAGGPPPGVGSVGGGPPPGPGSSGSSASNSAAADGQMEGAGSIATVVDGNRKRYVKATRQIRRMPVAITVVVDQAYMNDVLMAYANLPMRFQITQYHWSRFRDKLEGGGYGPSSSGGSDDIVGPARGMEGTGGIKFGSGAFAPGGPPGPGSYPKGPPGPGPGPIGPMGSGSTPGSLPSGSFSEAQLTAGLVELTIYGIVSIYEKYEPEPVAANP